MHFKNSDEVAELARSFVLVNFEDDEEPNSQAFRPVRAAVRMSLSHTAHSALM